MQYDVTSPAEYLKALEDDWRKDKLLEVRNMIRTHGEELTEGIEYKMLCYGDSNKNVFHLNAQKGYVSLYVGDIDKVQNGSELLKEFNLGKGCVRIKKSNDLSSLDTFIERVIDIWRAGGETDC